MSEQQEKVLTAEQVLGELNSRKDLYDRLVYIRATEGLELQMDNGWFWLEYQGETLGGTAGEWFTNSSDMYALLRFAGL